MRRRLLPALLACVAGQAMGSAATLQLLSDENAPFAYSNGQQITGLSTEMAQEAARRAGVAVRFNLYPWPRAYFNAQTAADTCIYPVVRLPERENQFRWVGPLNKNRWVLFARPDFAPAIAGLDDVKHYRVGGLQKDGPALFLQSQGVEVEQVSNSDLNFNKLLAGRIDLWATGFLRGKIVAAKAGTSELKVAYVLKDVDHYLACNPQTPAAALEAMDKALASMWKDGTAQRFGERYQKEIPPAP